MTLIGLILTLALVGFILWLITTLIPMDPTVKKVLVAVVCLVLVLWLLQVLGFDAALPTLRLTR